MEVPTNKPMIRDDMPDVVYKTEKAKFNAVIEQIIACYEKGQPVLVGTISIEKSELLSSMLKRRGIKHEVLNAKYHEKEAEIISQAGKKGAVTIATNMAGRGTDIKLGGNAEFMAKAEMRRMGYTEELISEATGFSETDNEEILEARETFKELNQKYKDHIKSEEEEVLKAGGLFIVGTERHESRRIDNQLRGRAGRQGDPGASRFFLSLEDDLMRLFGGERIQAIMDRFNLEEDVPIENKMVSNSVESAQRKLESRNFAIRKNVLQYDDVMNRQREIIYGQRAQVLNGDNIKDQIQKMISETIAYNVEQYLPKASDREHWNLESLRDYYLGWLTVPDDFHYTQEEIEELDPEFIEEIEELDPEFIVNTLQERAEKIYAAREKEYGEQIMRELERVVLLRNVDTQWMDHIDAMEELKQGIGLRAYAQRDPVVEYRIEGFDMFDAMVASIREDTARMMLTVRIRTQEEPKREQVAKPSENTGGDGSVKSSTVKKGKKIGRNDPCPCGSGKKYKKCCGRDA